MYYLQSRYYDPAICRFINCDDVNYIGIFKTEVSYNPFVYCENNPVNRIDFDGTNSKLLVAQSFAMAYGAYYCYGWILIAKMTAFISSIAPYLLAVVAVIVALYLAYKVTMLIEIASVSNKIPNKLKTKDGRVDLSKFKTKLPNGGGWKGPDNWKLVKDFAKHSGSVWKLYKGAKRIASLWGDGRIRGK